MSFAGVLVCGIAVGMFKYASFGVDPFQTLMSGLSACIPISFGTLYVIVNVFLLSVSLIFDRSRIGIATFINLFLLGYIIDGSLRVLKMLEETPSVFVRVMILFAGIVLLCLSSAFYFTADLGVSTYDAVSLILADRFRSIPFSVWRIVTDVFCVLCGMALCFRAGYTLKELGTVIGPGTVLTAFFMGPLIQWFRIHVSEPFLLKSQ